MTLDRALGEPPTLWRFESLRGLECLRATLHRHAFARHAHPTYVVAVGDGAGYGFSCDAGRRVAPPGSVVVLHPDETHDGYSVEPQPIAYRAFYPSAALLADALGDEAPPSFEFPRRVIDDRDPAARLRGAHDALAAEGASLRAESRLADALGVLVRRHASGAVRAPRAGAEREAVRRAKARLLERLDATVPLRELARDAGLSPFHFLRVFRAEVGLPPHAFVVRARLE